METIKTADRAAKGQLDVGQFVGAGLGYSVWHYASSVCDMNSASAVAVYAA